MRDCWHDDAAFLRPLMGAPRWWRRNPRRFFFVHLQKTAGTGLRSELMELYPGPALYPNRDDGDPVIDGPQIDVNRLVATVADPVRRESLRLVIGHFPYATIGLLDCEFTPVTVLREPVSRTLSYLRHYRVRHPELADEPLEALYERPDVYRIQIRDHMTKMLGMGPAEMTAGLLTDLELGPRHLEAARAALDSMPVVGTVERYEDFRSAARREFGWRLGEPRRLNQTRPEPVPPSFEQRIRADNALDMALYDYALGARRD